MSVVLLQHPADSGYVFNGKFEHDQRHGSFADSVVLRQVGFHGCGEAFEVDDLVVIFRIRIGVAEVSKNRLLCCGETW